jgi:hypothetical protein
MDLSFLSNVKLEVVKAAPTKKEAAPKLPENADLRVFGNGKVYPSVEFANKNSLEFVDRVNQGTGEKLTYVTGGNGLDIFSSKKWGMIMGQLPQELIFCAIVPKAAPKVDLFAATRYNEDNSPIASVFTQGSSVFSKEVLVPMLTEIYGVNWDEVEYVDLIVSTENVLVSPNGVYHLPKVVASGALKGEDTYIRRENLSVSPLIIKDVKTKTIASPSVSEDQPELNNSIVDLDQALAQEVEVVDPTVVGSPDQPVTATEESAVSLFDTPQTTTDKTPDWAAGLGVMPNTAGTL